MAFSFRNFFGMSDEDYDDDLEQEEQLQSAPEQRQPKITGNKKTEQKIVSMQGVASQQQKIVIYEPRIYSDVKEIANYLLSAQAVVINFSKLDEEQSKRIVDFITGTVYAINGDIQRVGNEIFLCTPVNFEVDGQLTDRIVQDDFR